MENKYYSPEIKDLLMLQEVEYLYEDEWLKGAVTGITVFELTIHNELLDKIAHVIYNPYDVEPVVRVKYLDQEDIESLGFKFSKKDSLGILRSTYISDPDSIVGRILDQRDGSTMCWHMKINCFENNVVKIECQMSDANEYTFFEGIIKNKSELKKVLKMIGYE